MRQADRLQGGRRLTFITVLVCFLRIREVQVHSAQTMPHLALHSILHSKLVSSPSSIFTCTCLFIFYFWCLMPLSLSYYYCHHHYYFVKDMQKPVLRSEKILDIVVCLNMTIGIRAHVRNPVLNLNKDNFLISLLRNVL